MIAAAFAMAGAVQADPTAEGAPLQPVPDATPSKSAATRPGAESTVTGSVLLDCIVSPHGLLTYCRVAEEQPHSRALETAALKLARYFKISDSGRFPPHSHIRVPMIFKQGAATAAAATAAPPG